MSGVRIRILIAALLSACALVLVLANRVQENISAKKRPSQLQTIRTLGGSESLAEIDATIDTMLVQRGIELSKVKKWQVLTREKRFLRIERRVLVPRDFLTLNLNLDLHRRLSQYGAQAVATERTKESIVTIHVKRNGFIIQSIGFVVQ
jgi:hypothetical protein